MRKTVLVFISILIAFLGGCSEQDSQGSLEKIEERGYIVLGLDDTFAPLGFRDENDEIVGFDIELAKRVAQEMGVELRIQPIEWDSKLLELNSGNIDMIWNGLTITEERQENINFSAPYLSNRQIVLTNNSSILDLSDLEGLKVGVQIDSSGETALSSNEIADKISETVRFNSFLEALLDLDSGRIDAIVIDEIMGRYVVSKGTYNCFVTDISLGSESYGIGFRLDDSDLRDEIDSVLTKLSSEGVTAEISEKWFGEDIFRK